MSTWAWDVVALSGLPGSGTTTAAGRIVARTGFRHVNTGALFREMAAERGMTLNDFGKLAGADFSIDRELDRRQVARAREGRILLEGRLAGFMLDRDKVPALKVWIEASLDVRVTRVADRDGLVFEVAREVSREREADERSRYLSIYGFDLEDLSIYDLVLDSSKLSPDDICRRILARLRGG